MTSCYCSDFEADFSVSEKCNDENIPIIQKCKDENKSSNTENEHVEDEICFNSGKSNCSCPDNEDNISERSSIINNENNDDKRTNCDLNLIVTSKTCNSRKKSNFLCENDDKSSIISDISNQSQISSSASVSSIASFPEYNLKPNMPLLDIKKCLAELIHKKGKNLIRACRNFDRKATNQIHKTKLRQLLRTFCFPLTAAQFDSLLSDMKIYESGKMNYMDFFSTLVDGESINYEHIAERIEYLPIDEVELRIKEKITPVLRDVIRSFWLFDVNKDGYIQKSELRRIIKNYCFDLNEQLYDEFWKSHDVKAKGLINYKEFLIKLGISAERFKTFMPSETVARALCWSDKKSMDLTDDINIDQRICQAAIENKNDPAVQGLPVDDVATIFTNRLQKKSNLLERIFCMFDYEKSGEVSMTDFVGVINFFLMPMCPTLFHDVFQRLDFNITPCCKVNYRDFLEKCCCIKIGTKLNQRSKVDCLPVIQHIKNHILNPDACLRSVFTKKNADCDTLKEVKYSHDHEKYLNLTGEKLKSKFKHHLNKEIKNVEKAILICDPNQSGFIPLEKLSTILKGFCFPLREEQFEELISEFKTHRDNLKYQEFLNGYAKVSGEDTKKWVAIVNKLANFKSRCPPEMSLDEAEEMLRENIQSRKSSILKDFKSLDVCNVGIISKDDARNIFNKFSFRLSDKQEVLLSQAPFLNKIIESIEPVIVRNVRTIRYHLHRADTKMTGKVDFNVLTNILEKSGIRFTSEEEFYILECFDTCLSGKINYRDFLQIFVWYA